MSSSADLELPWQMQRKKGRGKRGEERATCNVGGEALPSLFASHW
jgi:hypothetical protein